MKYVAVITASVGLTVELLSAGLSAPGAKVIAPPLIASTSGVFTPSVTPGPVTLAAPLIPSGAAMFAPTVAVAGTQSIATPFLASGASVFAPSVVPGTVTVAPPLLASGSTMFAPVVALAGSMTIAPPFLAATGGVFAPVVTPGPVTIAPPLLGSGAVMFAPTVVAATTLPQSASIVARWSPDALTPVANGTALASYADAVNGIAMTQATGANQPTYKTAGANGKPYIGMSGAQAMRVTANSALATGLASGAYTILAFFRNGTAKSTAVIWQAKGAAEYAQAAATAGVSWGSTTYPHTGSAGSTDIQSIGMVQKTGVSSLFNALVLNGCIISMGFSTWAAQDGTFGIGYTTPGSSFQGELYDVIIWSVPLTAAELVQAQKWACEKYGQTPRWVTRGRMDVACGDSQVLGANTTAYQTDNFFTKTCNALSAPVGTWINVGQTGRRTDTELAAYATAALDNIPSITGVPTNHVYLEYYNMRTLTGSQIATANLAYAAARKAAGYNKIAMLTAYDSSAHPTSRAGYISDMVAGYAANGISDLIRVDTDTDFGVDGTIPAGSSTYSSDGTHLNTAGNDLVRSRWVQPVMSAW